jgi:hypothetical protein
MRARAETTKQTVSHHHWRTQGFQRLLAAALPQRPGGLQRLICDHTIHAPRLLSIKSDQISLVTKNIVPLGTHTEPEILFRALRTPRPKS